MRSWRAPGGVISGHLAECREAAQGVEAGQEKVSPAAHGGECRQARESPSDRAPWNVEFQSAAVIADDRVALRYMK